MENNAMQIRTVIRAQDFSVLKEFALVQLHLNGMLKHLNVTRALKITWKEATTAVCFHILCFVLYDNMFICNL